MEVYIAADPETAAAWVAGLLVRKVRDHPESVLGLATGATMIPVYAECVRRFRALDLDLSRVRSFNLDEYLGLGSDDPRSFHAFMRKHLIEPAGMDPARTRLPDGLAADPRAEAARYEEALSLAGGIDWQLLGLGANGHVGFNEPLSGFSSRTRPVRLTGHTRRANARDFGGDPEAVPEYALTMGLGTILEARHCVVLATGAHKADAAARAIEGPMTAMTPASALQWHASCTVVLDEGAAGRLQERGLYGCRLEEEEDARDPGAAK